MTRTYAISRALRGLRVFVWSFDSFTGLSVLFVIGYDDYYGFSSTFYLGFGFGSRHTQSIELYVTA